MMGEIERLAEIIRSGIVADDVGYMTDADSHDLVRAMLRAIREPSPGMAEAAQARQVVVTGDEPSVLGVRSCWRAMIDHILEDR